MFLFIQTLQGIRYSVCLCVCVTVVRDELLVLVAEDEHVVFQSDEVQVLIIHLRHTHTHSQLTYDNKRLYIKKTWVLLCLLCVMLNMTKMAC